MAHGTNYTTRRFERTVPAGLLPNVAALINALFPAGSYPGASPGAAIDFRFYREGSTLRDPTTTGVVSANLTVEVGLSDVEMEAQLAAGEVGNSVNIHRCGP